ncbi:uncharacterized protein LOC131595770 isoform X4 [Vicia villosa]|uniref:uncharacterized protein LOC131595770 isoform X4 n=1 Tax=Vicia villosa TaxID=3911 RepID=UPI00273C3101|nr:uncharacterized protein LOC131595770 isoform X4 [Vicia villosa]
MKNDKGPELHKERFKNKKRGKQVYVSFPPPPPPIIVVLCVHFRPSEDAPATLCFLQPADSNNTELQQWLCKEKVSNRHRVFHYPNYDLPFHIWHATHKADFIIFIFTGSCEYF